MKPSQPIVPSRATASRTTLRRMTLLLLTGALSASCGGDERSILVHVNGIPAGTPSACAPLRYSAARPTSAWTSRNRLTLLGSSCQPATAAR